MIVRTTRFTLADNDGEEHLYECTHFKLPQRFRLKLRIAKISGGVLARTAQALAPALAHLGGGDASAVMSRVKRAAQAVDWDAFATAVESFPEAIEAAGGFQLISDILRKTTRERHEPAGDGGRGAVIPAKLNNDTALDIAYGAANMVEMYKAVLMVLAINMSPFGKSESVSWSELSGTLISWLPMRKTKSTGTGTPKGDS